MSRAVEVVLDGRLGNQMFQYAAGRAVSIRLALPLVLHVSELHLGPDPFDLPCFRLTPLTVRDLPIPLFHTRLRWLAYLDKRGLGRMKFVSEEGPQFAPALSSVDGPCVLVGYWQSDRHFAAVEDRLRADFTFSTAPDVRNAECANRIHSAASIALHVRRGDYVSNAEHNALHGTCSPDYYSAALDLAVSRLGAGAELFVFSDDMNWSRTAIRAAIPTTFVDWNADRGYEDLRLMSEARVVVMANSTFSWWAGWLNRRPDKLVIGPKEWYRSSDQRSDLPLSSWITTL